MRRRARRARRVAAPVPLRRRLTRGAEPVSAPNACRYYIQDLRRAPLRARARARFAGARAPAYRAPRRGHRAAGAVHFRAPRIRRVRCNTVPSGCRPPWPPPRCRDARAPFAPARGRLAPRGVRSPSQPALTAGCPLARARTGRPGAPARIRSLLAAQHPLYRACRARAAVLRDISAGTSYQAVRLVFRPYAHLLPASCTSARRRPSAGVSAGFRHGTRSSPPFGSPRGDSRRCSGRAARAPPRRRAGLPGPCFDTGPARRGSCTFTLRAPRASSAFARATCALSASRRV